MLALLSLFMGDKGEVIRRSSIKLNGYQDDDNDIGVARTLDVSIRVPIP